jgi:hypothetical protein
VKGDEIVAGFFLSAFGFFASRVLRFCPLAIMISCGEPIVDAVIGINRDRRRCISSLRTDVTTPLHVRQADQVRRSHISVTA